MCVNMCEKVGFEGEGETGGHNGSASLRAKRISTKFVIKYNLFRVIHPANLLSDPHSFTTLPILTRPLVNKLVKQAGTEQSP